MPKDPRDFAADAKDQLDAFEEALRRTVGDRGVIVKAIQAQGRKEHREMAALFQRQRFADANGRIRWLGAITAAWVARKLRLGGRPERGQFTRGILRQIKSRKAFVPLTDGFDIDITLPDLTTRVPLRVKGSKRKGGPRSKRVKVNDYLPYYAQQKAVGLGALSNVALKRIQKARADAEEKQYRRMRNIALSAAKGGRLRVVEVKMILERLRA